MQRQSGARLLVDGPAGEHELVLKGRLATQAPDIDASVYLTECDPSAFSAGDFAEVEIVGARIATADTDDGEAVALGSHGISATGARIV